MTNEQLKHLKDNPKEFLGQAFRAEERMTAMQERIARLRSKAADISLTLQPVVAYTNTPTNKVETCVCAIIELQDELKEEVAGFARRVRAIAYAIERFAGSESERALLELRYLSYYSWEEISVRLSYSYRWALRLHGRALQGISEAAGRKLAIG